MFQNYLKSVLRNIKRQKGYSLITLAGLFIGCDDPIGKRFWFREEEKGVVVGVAFVLMANAIAWPVAYFAMQNWLQNFAYRIEIGVWIFALSATLSLAIALLTVSYQTIKAAFANPVDSLRYE